MRMIGKLAAFSGLALVIAGLGIVTFVGPWPTYSSNFEDKANFKQALADIDANAKESELTANPGPLQAGWAKRCINPPKPGVPMAGYGDRKGAPSEGVHDDVNVKALALSDGKDTVVLVGVDMVIIPENVADMVRADVASRTPLTANDIYLGASHTHASVGAFGPGIAAYVTGGKYDPDIPPFLCKAFSDAIVEAYENLKPAKLAHGTIDATQYIRNRTRDAAVDGGLNYLLVEQDGGAKCYLVSFSAHPTILGGNEQMLYSAEYPGALQRDIEKTGAFGMYLGGALGSMSPKAPDAPDPFARVEAMGKALSDLVLKDAKNPAYETNLDVASVGVNAQMQPLQIRVLSPKWRFSKFLGPLVGLDNDGWVQAARIGNIMFVGMPADFSGEISIKWKEAAKQAGYDMWVTSFAGDYVGYVSPDEYYEEVTDEEGSPAYETGLMSWSGPHQEAFFTALKDRMVQSLTQGS